jgi:Protein of unknown function (DUF2568)
VKALNLAVRFACELAALVAVAWYGWRINPVLGVAFPLALAAVWGMWIAPKAQRRLRDPARIALELVVFAAATAALVSVGQTLVAVVFAAAAVGTAALVRVWPEPVT